jgi:hypothetical protein
MITILHFLSVYIVNENNKKDVIQKKEVRTEDSASNNNCLNYS